MKDLSAVREVLRYVHRFSGSTIFVKLGKNIIDISKRLGIIRDLCAIKNSGINIVLAHDSIEFNTKKIADPKLFFCDSDNFISNKCCSKAIPVIYCPNKNGLSSDKRIVLTAVKNNAKKLIYVTSRKGIFDGNKKLISEMSISEAKILINSGIVKKGMKTKLEVSCLACENGVSRVHIISGLESGSILHEVFSCEGSGTMIYANTPYKYIRQAVVEDVISILDIVSDSEISISTLYSRIVDMISSFYIFAIDKEVLGCAQLKFGKNNSAEILYLSSFSYCKQAEISRELIRYITQSALKSGVNRIYFNSDKNFIWITIYPWFKNDGFRKFSKHGEKGGSHIWVKKL